MRILVLGLRPLYMKALCSFRVSGTTHLKTQCHILEDLKLENKPVGVSNLCTFYIIKYYKLKKQKNIIK